MSCPPSAISKEQRVLTEVVRASERSEKLPEGSDWTTTSPDCTIEINLQWARLLTATRIAVSKLKQAEGNDAGLSRCANRWRLVEVGFFLGRTAFGVETATPEEGGGKPSVAKLVPSLGLSSDTELWVVSCWVCEC